MSFSEAFDSMSDFEGRAQWSDRSDDPGGETYWGISRRWWPEAAVWRNVDRWKNGEFDTSELNCRCDPLVREFYRVNFWNRFQGDAVDAESPAIAAELLEAGVNLGVHRAVGFLQEALNRGELVQILPEYSFEPLNIYAMYPSRNYLPLKVKRLIEFLKMRLASGYL